MLRPVRGRRGTGAKVLQSLGVVGTGLAVTGLGTFGRFTDSTTPVDAEVGGGTVSIDVTDPNPLGTLPLDVDGLLPGGSTTRTVSLVNDGTADLVAVTMSAVPTVSSVLDTDAADGLQTTVRACSVPWSAEATCAGVQRTVLAAGPVVREAPLDRPASLVAGGTDHLALTVFLPERAGNEFAGRSSAVQFTFTAVQRPGTAR
jgi:hypothetical protein